MINTCNVAAASQITNNTNNDSISVGDFFAKRGGDVLKATEIAKKPRRNISSVIAGKAITEIDVSQKIEEYQLETARNKNKPNGSKTKKIVNRNRIRNSPIMNNSLGLQKKTPKSLTLITAVIYPMKTSAFTTRRSVVFVVTLNQRLCEINLTLNL